MKISIFLFLLFYSYLSSGQDRCSKVNLLEDPALTNRENLNQKDSNWCYAYAAADAFSLLFKQPVSAVDLAIQYHADKGSSLAELLEGGRASELDAVVNKHGLCPEVEYQFAVLGWTDTLNQINYFKNNPDLCVTDNFERFWTPSFYKNLSDVSEIREVLFKNIQNSTPKALQSLANLNCKNKRIMPDRKIKAIYQSFRIGWDDLDGLDKLKNYVDQGLEARQVSVLTIDTTQYLKTSGRVLDKLKSQIQGTHSVSLLGRKKVGDKCVYTIRDSSVICPLVKSEVTCDMDNKTVDIPEDIFLKSIKGSTRFELTTSKDEQ